MLDTRPATYSDLDSSLGIAVKLRRANATYRYIASALNDRGLRTLRARLWTTQSVYNMLRDLDEFRSAKDLERRRRQVRSAVVRAAVQEVMRDARRVALFRMRKSSE